MKSRARIYAFLASVLFGINTPLAKTLLNEIHPVQLAGLLYLGAGVGLLLFRIVQRAVSPRTDEHAAFNRHDFLWLCGAIVSGGLLAPVMLMLGLKTAPSSTASILLNFEAASTTLIACMVFREHIGKRVWFALALITVASIVLSLEMRGQWGVSLGAVAVMASYALWGIDNNCTRKISGKDSIFIVIVKGLTAGTINLVLSGFMGISMPQLSAVAWAMVLGCLSYGVSLLFFVWALRELGASRTSTIFGTAPFIGAVLSVLILWEVPTLQFVVSIPFMVIGAFLLLRESHVHLHIHEAMAHEHLHTHDDGHHDHEHAGLTEAEKAHVHGHFHGRVDHVHEHTPDLHHEHVHYPRSLPCGAPQAHGGTRAISDRNGSAAPH